MRKILTVREQYEGLTPWLWREADNDAPMLPDPTMGQKDTGGMVGPPPDYSHDKVDNGGWLQQDVINPIKRDVIAPIKGLYSDHTDLNKKFIDTVGGALSGGNSPADGVPHSGNPASVTPALTGFALAEQDNEEP